MDARDIINLQEAYLQVYSESELTEEALIAAEYFYEQGLNEDGVNQLIEELGVDEFVDWIDEIVEDWHLTEARRSGRIEPVTKSGKSVGSLRGGAKSAAITRLRKEKAARRESEAGSERPSGMKAALRSQAMTAATSKQKPSAPQQKTPAKSKAGIGAAIGGALKWAQEKGAKDLEQTRQGLQTLGKTWQNISDTKAAQAARIGLKKGSRAIEKHGHTVGSAAGRAAGQFVRSLRKEECEEILSHLLDEGYAETLESAEAILESMSDGWVSEILDEANKAERMLKLTPGERERARNLNQYSDTPIFYRNTKRGRGDNSDPILNRAHKEMSRKRRASHKAGRHLRGDTGESGNVVRSRYQANKGHEDGYPSIRGIDT